MTPLLVFDTTFLQGYTPGTTAGYIAPTSSQPPMVTSGHGPMVTAGHVPQVSAANRPPVGFIEFGHLWLSGKGCLQHV